jgi:predicted outer membrane repeat protein
MRIVYVAAVCVLLVGSNAQAVDHWVPDQFGTISAALVAGSPGDNIMVRAGTYPESIVLVDGVSVIGVDGAVVTTIDGGGAAHTIDANGITATIEGFTIKGGSAPTTGGGIRIWNAADVTVQSCVFSDNTSGGQGGGMAIQNSRVTVDLCQFVNNTGGSGAALLLNGTQLADVLIRNTDFSGNTATGNGGAVFATNSAFRMESCRIFDNMAAALGGGIALETSTPDILSSSIYANASTEGGGISYHSSSAGTLTGSTFYQNTANQGGAISCTNNSSPVIDRCVMASSTGGGAMKCAVGSNPSVACSNLWNNLGGNGDTLCGVDGGNNISADPEFCRLDPAAEGVFTVQLDSPNTALNSPCGQIIGTAGTGCGVTALQGLSWGLLKAEYR